MQLPYSSKATAVRGAKRSGIENPRVEERDGKWYILGEVVAADQVPPGTYNATIETVTVDDTGKVEVVATVDGTDLTIKSSFEPDLSPETRALAEKTIENAKVDLAKLAATLPQPVTSTPEEIAARRAERQARIAADKANAANAPKVPTYKEMLRVSPNKSTIVKPIDVIRDYLGKNYAVKGRKECIADLVALGINIMTARTQYQLFRKKQIDGAGPGAGGVL